MVSTAPFEALLQDDFETGEQEVSTWIMRKHLTDSEDVRFVIEDAETFSPRTTRRSSQYRDLRI
jgi:hypothetical protein